MSDNGSVVVIGGTSEIGMGIAKHYADEGREVWLSSRDTERAANAAKQIGGNTTGFVLDLNDAAEIEAPLSDIGPVQRLVLVAIERDANTLADFNPESAAKLFTLKLVGYTQVIHVLASRLTDDASMVLFGGLAKEKPYPGGTTVATVNGGIATLVHALTLELAPKRVNAIHPAIVGDSWFWADKPREVIEGFRSRTPTGTLVTVADVTDAAVFLLENPGMNGSNLNLDAGWLRT